MVPIDTPGKIEISGLSKTFGRVKAVDSVSFTVEPGSITGFLGPNGAGKTTTLRMLLGLMTPDAGTARIGGLDYRDLPCPSATVGAALDASGFHPARSGRGHLRILCTVNGFPAKRADEVLDLVDLATAGRRALRGYSLGMRQRLSLAAALLGDPDVVVLDEPANGLDPEGIQWMRRLLRDLADRGRTVLVSSHVLSEMQLLVDRVVILNKGRSIRQGTLAELSDAHGGGVSVRSPRLDALLEALRKKHGVHNGRIDRRAPDLARIGGADTAGIGHLAHVEGIELHELAADGGDLEEVFFALTNESTEER